MMLRMCLIEEEEQSGRRRVGEVHQVVKSGTELVGTELVGMDFFILSSSFKLLSL